MRWTHIALPCHDIDKSIEWYTRYTTLEVLDRRSDPEGYGAWLGHPDQADNPFILVLVSFFKDQEKGPQPIMAPFAHIGIEVPSRTEVERIAEMGRAEGLPDVAADRHARPHWLHLRGRPTPTATSSRSHTTKASTTRPWRSGATKRPRSRSLALRASAHRVGSMSATASVRGLIGPGRDPTTTEHQEEAGNGDRCDLLVENDRAEDDRRSRGSRT